MWRNNTEMPYKWWVYNSSTCIAYEKWFLISFTLFKISLANFVLKSAQSIYFTPGFGTKMWPNNNEMSYKLWVCNSSTCIIYEKWFLISIYTIKIFLGVFLSEKSSINVFYPQFGPKMWANYAEMSYKFWVCNSSTCITYEIWFLISI